MRTKTRRVREFKTHALCLRLTEKQFGILQRYTDVKGFNSEVEALRHIVDGLEAWLARQDVDEPAEERGAPPASAVDQGRTQA